VSVRFEGVERRRRRHDDSDHSSHNDDVKHVFRPRRGQRQEAFGNHMLRRDNDEEEHGFREVKDVRSLGTIHLKEIGCGGKL